MEPVNPTEAKIAAYEIAMRITPRAWDVTEVKQRADRILRFLLEDRDRAAFGLRYTALDLQTTALGCHPRHLTGTVRPAPRTYSRDVPDVGNADDLITAARKICTWLSA